MKTLIASIILVFCVNISINAQNNFGRNKIASDKEIYKCISLSPRTNTYILENVKNKLTNAKMIIPKNPEAGFSSIIGNELVDKTIVSIFQEIMTKEDILKMNHAKDRIIITFYINDSGKVLELGFLVSKNTSFKPQYLAKVEQRIKKEVTFSFASNELKGANFLRFNRIYRF
ncbi:MAG: hypothetical protein HXX14_10505 [Bacteroidetes bacterium]|nr:hypothetical protein [Bacteroidota bacterium]